MFKQDPHVAKGICPENDDLGKIFYDFYVFGDFLDICVVCSLWIDEIKNIFIQFYH